MSERKRVTLPLTCGVLAVGSTKPGQTIEVAAAEAERLVKKKGFVYADAEPAPQAEAEAETPKPRGRRAATGDDTQRED